LTEQCGASGTGPRRPMALEHRILCYGNKTVVFD